MRDRSLSVSRVSNRGPLATPSYFSNKWILNTSTNIFNQKVAGFVIVNDIPVLEAGDSFHLFSRALTTPIVDEVCVLACRDTSTCWVVLLVGSCNRGITTESSDGLGPWELAFIS